MTGIRNTMYLLVKRAESLAKAGKEHHDICVQLADEYQLWMDDMFPIWLSRVVEGAIADVEDDAEQDRLNSEYDGELKSSQA